MKKLYSFFIISIIWMISADVSAGLTFTSGIPSITACSEPSVLNNTTDGRRFIPVTNYTSTGSSGTDISCEEHGAYESEELPSNSYYPQGNSGAVIQSCGDDRYALDMMCYNYNSTTLQYDLVPDCTENGAGWTHYKLSCQKLDDTPPTIDDINFHSASIQPDSYKLADIHTVRFDSVSTGSTIHKVIGTIEHYDNPELRLTHTFSGGTTPALAEQVNLTNVDKRVLSAGYRDYIFRVTEICDIAGNCSGSAVNVPYKFNIHANTIDTGHTTITGISDLSNEANFADGSVKSVQLALKDRYNNQIIPVSTAAGVSLRGVTVDINHVNDLYLNQKTLSGDSGVYIGSTPVNFSGSTRFRNYGNGIYNWDFKIFTPTQNTNPLAKGNFTINSIEADISDLSGVEYRSSGGSFKFKPPYTTSITGDIVDDKQFIEGAVQDSSITLTTNKIVSGSINKTLYVSFGKEGVVSGTNTAASEFNMRSLSPLKTLEFGLIGAFTLANIDSLRTLLKLKPGGKLDDINKTYLATHIGYTIDGKDVLYNGDIFGKNNYHGLFSGNESKAIGIKIEGTTSAADEKIVELVTDQDKDIKTVAGSITKSNLKKQIRQSAYNVIKNVTPVAGNKIQNIAGESWSIQNPGVLLQDKSILYYGNVTNKTLSTNISTSQKIEGQKTIIVKGADLYITDNLVKKSESDILGIIVLQDENQVGGNIYIDPSVTRVDAIMYADKSLLSALDSNNNDQIEGTEVINGSDVSQEVLKNQMYIKGSIFTENTIGGSNKVVPLCPYFVSTCNLEIAQRYDLNYLRRYINSGGSGLNGGINYFNDYDNSSYNNADYPVVIEYDPQIQLTPPPVFDGE